MPAYNAQKFIGPAIESILDQSYPHFEFIIIDDCSTDDTWKIIQKYARKDKRIHAYKNKENLKIVKTRNKGFNLASKKAKYFAIFDSDDISLRDRLERQVRFLEKHQDHALVGSSTYIINEEGKQVGFRAYPLSNEQLQKALIRYDPIAQPSVMIRASVLRNDIGFYNERYTRCQDYELWFRIAQKYKIANLKKPVIEYRISSTQGKRTHLKETLKFTLEIQKQWLFTQKYFSLLLVLRWMLIHLLFLLPDRVILSIFKFITYNK
jgi:glycosyltransferase involved in cell wall biosynthesis